MSYTVIAFWLLSYIVITEKDTQKERKKIGRRMTKSVREEVANIKVLSVS